MDIGSKISEGLKAAKNTNLYKHFRTITEHKLEVGKNCFRCGLYKQGILHDLSKYSPSEFVMGVKYYQGNRSPNDAEREDKGYTSAWLHHKGRNKHHLEYWIDYDMVKRDGTMTGMKMPDNYIVEMFCDRVAASKIYNGDKYVDSTPLNYFLNGKSKGAMHPYVRNKLHLLLNMLAEEGEDKTFRFAKRYIKEYKKYLKRQKYKARTKAKLEKKYSDMASEKLEKKYSRRVNSDRRKSHIAAGISGKISQMQHS